MALTLAGCTGRQVLNTLTPERGYDFAQDLPYNGTRNLKLDVYTPSGASKAPVVVFFYGGRWSTGDKSQFRFVGQALAASGSVVVMPNLRLYPEARFPGFVEDAASAVRWTRDHIAEYGGDPGKLFLAGHSSGAHVAALLALNEQVLGAVGIQRKSIKGMIGLAGPYDFLPITAPDLRDVFGPPERFALSQPIYYVDGQNPPVLLLHGENDEVIPVRNTQNLAAAISRAGGPVETVLYPRMSHSMLIGSLGPMLRSTSDVLDHVVGFIRDQADRAPLTDETGIRATPLPESESLLQPR